MAISLSSPMSAATGSTGRYFGNTPPAKTIESVMDRNFVTLPAWFPAAKAASVLRSLGREFAVVAGSGGRIGIASLAELACARADKTTEWCGTTMTVFAKPRDQAEQALMTMTTAELDRLAVKVGGLVVGVVTKSALARALARPTETVTSEPAADATNCPLAA